MDNKLAFRQLHDDLSQVQKQLQELFDKEQKVSVDLSSVEVSNFPVPLPIDFPEVQLTEVVNVVETSVNNLDELIAYVENLRQTIEEVMDSPKEVTVLNPASEVAISNLGTVQTLLREIINKDTGLTLPKAPRDAIPVVLTDKDRNKLYNAVFQGGGGGSNVPVVDDRVPVTPQSFIPTDYDYLSVAYPNASTEVYTYRKGGSSGTIQATITTVYTDATKDNLSSVSRA